MPSSEERARELAYRKWFRDPDSAMCNWGEWKAAWSAGRAPLLDSLDTLKAKNQDLHRRAQQAESIVAQSGVVGDRPQHAKGRSFGRALANYAAAQARREGDALKQENKRLRAALEFSGEEENHVTTSTGFAIQYDPVRPAAHDGGAKARAALKGAPE